MKCEHCKSENHQDRRFCLNCGSPLSRVCPNCTFLNEAEARYCGECGTFLSTTGKSGLQQFISAQITVPENLLNKIRSSRNYMEGERKQVSVLFADMQGYTPLAESLGEEKIYELMNRVYERMLNAVHQFEGTVQELTGDGILALFGAPIALEDAPVRACRAALEIQQQMIELGATIEEECGMRPKVRIGIHTGPVVVGTVGTDLRMEFKAVGDTVNLASRLESMADAETILISEVTHRLVDAYVESSNVGELTIKGKSEPQWCYRLHGMRDASDRFDASLRRGLTPLVGHAEELQVLNESFLEAQQGKQCVVDVVGEAGTGKSRLLYEFKRSVHGEDILILETHCSTSGQSTAFFPVISILKTMFRLQEHMTSQEIQTLVSKGMARLELESDTRLPFLLNLLGLDVSTDNFRGLDAEIIGARTRDALKEVCEAYCRSFTAIILIEDLHWVDSATEQLLQSLIVAGHPHNSLILTTFRPEYVPPWNDSRNVTRLELTPLTEEKCAQLVRHCLGPYATSEDLVQSVVLRVEGNPLFAEELSRYLQDTTDSSQAEKMHTLANDAIDKPLPESLRDIIMARVDRLEEGARDLLLMMSVVGREFSLDLIQQLWAQSDELPVLVNQLKDSGLISGLEQRNRDTYSFKHILIQEAVYDSLLASRRTVLHEDVAQAFETLYADGLGEYAETLAYHWKKSAQPVRAIPFQAMAGKKSLGVYSLEEANQWFQQAIEQMNASPDYVDDTLLADVLLNWARVYYYRKDFRGLIHILEEHLTRIESLGDQRRLSLALFWLGFAHYFATRYDVSRTMLHKALELGRQQDDAECIGYASLGLMFVSANVPAESPADSLEYLGKDVLSAASQLSDVYLESKYLLCMTIHTIYQGRYCDAREYCARMQLLGERVSDPRTITMSQWSLGFVNVFEEKFEQALENAETSLKHSPDPLDKLMAQTVKGVALALMGKPVEGLLVLQLVRSEMLEADYLAPLLGLDIPYGAAIALAGKMRVGVHWIEEAIERFTQSGNKAQPAFGRLVLGEIYLQMALGENKPSLGIMIKNLSFILMNLPVATRKARFYLEQVVSECRENDVPANLARALMDLARLNQHQKRTDEALACLSEASVIAEPQVPALYAKIIEMQQQLHVSH